MIQNTNLQDLIDQGNQEIYSLKQNIFDLKADRNQKEMTVNSQDL